MLEEERLELTYLIVRVRQPVGRGELSLWELSSFVTT